MAASRINYIVTWDGQSQVYGCASKEGALETPAPKGSTLEEKRVFFITHEPDNGVISVHEIPRDEVFSAEIKHPKPRKKPEDVED
jgi:hypothetical protein